MGTARPPTPDLASFQSAPRPFDRGDICLDDVHAIWGRFNPRPGLSTGAIAPRPALRRNRLVSIRAPAFRPGRLLTACPLPSPLTFQSAPRPFDRGDRRWSAAKDAAIAFQSAPRPFDRGDHSITAQPATGCWFQSAPRPFDRGDIGPRNALHPLELFQSAPRPFDRGDSIAIASAR